MITKHAYDLILDDIFLQVDGVADLRKFYIKVESFNPAGSVKMKTARGLVEAAESSSGDLSETTLIESSSGNMGIALAVICAAKKYRLICVTDPNSNAAAGSIMRALGAEVVVVRDRDAEGGYLAHPDLLHQRAPRRRAESLLAQPVRESEQSGGP